MKFKGRNGGMAIALRNHIMLFRVFVISLFVFMIPTIIFVCIHNPYFWIFLIAPIMFLVFSLAVFLFIKYDENVFLEGTQKDHLFEIKNNCLFKDGKEMKMIQSVKIYRYKGFLYMKTSHSVFVIKDTDFLVGDRNSFLDWAKLSHIRVLRGY